MGIIGKKESSLILSLIANGAFDLENLRSYGMSEALASLLARGIIEQDEISSLCYINPKMVQCMKVYDWGELFDLSDWTKQAIKAFLSGHSELAQNWLITKIDKIKLASNLHQTVLPYSDKLASSSHQTCMFIEAPYIFLVEDIEYTDTQFHAVRHVSHSSPSHEIASTPPANILDTPTSCPKYVAGQMATPTVPLRCAPQEVSGDNPPDADASDDIKNIKNRLSPVSPPVRLAPPIVKNFTIEKNDEKFKKDDTEGVTHTPETQQEASHGALDPQKVSTQRGMFQDGLKTQKNGIGENQENATPELPDSSYQVEDRLNGIVDLGMKVAAATGLDAKLVVAFFDPDKRKNFMKAVDFYTDQTDRREKNVLARTQMMQAILGIAKAEGDFESFARMAMCVDRVAGLYARNDSKKKLYKKGSSPQEKYREFLEQITSFYVNFDPNKVSRPYSDRHISELRALWETVKPQRNSVFDSKTKELIDAREALSSCQWNIDNISQHPKASGTAICRQDQKMKDFMASIGRPNAKIAKGPEAFIAFIQMCATKPYKDYDPLNVSGSYIEPEVKAGDFDKFFNFFLKKPIAQSDPNCTTIF